MEKPKNMTLEEWLKGPWLTAVETGSPLDSKTVQEWLKTRMWNDTKEVAARLAEKRIEKPKEEEFTSEWDLD